jgi:hypothetical protein
MERCADQLDIENGAVPLPGSDNFDTDMLFVNALQNCHSCDHCNNCFKNKKPECRMKLPKKPAPEDCVTFDETPTAWYTWEGAQQQRHLFTLEQKRDKRDCFTNTYNPIASKLFNCNTNIVCGVDGVY